MTSSLAVLSRSVNWKYMFALVQIGQSGLPYAAAFLVALNVLYNSTPHGLADVTRADLRQHLSSVSKSCLLNQLA